MRKRSESTCNKASEQMFPEEHQKSEQIDETLAKLEAAYKAQKAAS